MPEDVGPARVDDQEIGSRASRGAPVDTVADGEVANALAHFVSDHGPAEILVILDHNGERSHLSPCPF
ncbi:hypothetical protein ACF1AU_09900 [Streptomyces rubrogriseus]|uniref:hypothetical protein n=1 Tax=Streptomyces rubrogriseus TaxID=194673 RepID=UPI0036FA51C6